MQAACPSLSAVLLAGGASRRMGRDKALLSLPGSDRPLWRHQWQLLKKLQPKALFWSGPPRPQMPQEAHLVSDLFPDAGPLAGISACLDIMSSDLLVVLAIDLPRMTPAFLRGLLVQCAPGRGAVVQGPDFFEPLAAVYPKRLQALAGKHLVEGRYSLQDFIGEAIREQALRPIPLADEDLALFQNLNTPSDISDKS